MNPAALLVIAEQQFTVLQPDDTALITGVVRVVVRENMFHIADHEATLKISKTCIEPEKH
jgi:hypothetical protein